MSIREPSPEEVSGPDDLEVAGATLGLQVTHPRADAVVIAASGEIDEATVAHFEEVLAPRLLASVRVVVVDLSAVEFLGVPGLQLLTQTHLRAQDRGLELRLVADDHGVARALRIAKLDAVLSWYSTVADALNADPQTPDRAEPVPEACGASSTVRKRKLPAMAIDDTPLEFFAALARELTAQTSKQAVLDRVVELAVRHLDGCDDAGILLLYRKRGVETVTASSRRIHDSDQAQGRLRQGPCFDAALQAGAWHNRVYRSDDLATETRWPSYTPHARALGIGSMLGFQLYRDEEFFAALDLYSDRRQAFGERAEQVGWVFASYAAVVLISARTGKLPGVPPPEEA